MGRSFYAPLNSEYDNLLGLILSYTEAVELCTTKARDNPNDTGALYHLHTECSTLDNLLAIYRPTEPS